ncbi:MAG: hypothetical protein ACTSRA_18255 [Promethearchaeota archaeon]
MTDKEKTEKHESDFEPRIFDDSEIDNEIEDMLGSLIELQLKEEKINNLNLEWQKQIVKIKQKKPKYFL